MLSPVLTFKGLKRVQNIVTKKHKDTPSTSVSLTDKSLGKNVIIIHIDVLIFGLTCDNLSADSCVSYQAHSCQISTEAQTLTRILIGHIIKIIGVGI